MLVDINLVSKPSITLDAIQSIKGIVLPIRIAKGIYQFNHWNPEYHIREKIDFIPDDHNLPAYGVIDKPDQLTELFDFTCTDALIATLVCIDRSEEVYGGGWRWHKWGTYYGNQKPTHEYLYEDTHIDKVYTFSIYEVAQ